jgi:hypothetical protein
MGFLKIAHDILNFEINDSYRVTRWRVKKKTPIIYSEI